MTEIRLYNTATRRKDTLVPVTPGRVGMYVCGPTVYDRAHIGNARPVVVFDVLFRLLRHVYGEDRVTYIRNFTDVDDKINARAAETGRSIREITDETIGWYRDDMAALGALPPTHEPRATEYIAPMVAMIETLIARGHAYEAEGHVLFSVASYPEYGHLARRSLDEMRAGARVEVAPYKRDPMDFVLWKPSTPDQPGWDSPWGRGRPGWHIECSAMAYELLGPSFDIHGGGIDLAFPHHENEVAQSRCAHPEGSFASIWMHNGFLNVEGEKMSKSLGNFFTVRDLLDRGIPGEVIRFVLLSTHYHQPMDWTGAAVEEAEKAYQELSLTIGDAWDDYLDWKGYADSGGKPSKSVISALSDDLNTHEALRIILENARAAKSGDPDKRRQLISDMVLLGIGGDERPTSAMWQGSGLGYPGSATEAFIKHISGLRDKWHELRSQRDFAAADALRARVEAAGGELRATQVGPEIVVFRESSFKALMELEP